MAGLMPWAISGVAPQLGGQPQGHSGTTRPATTRCRAHGRPADAGDARAGRRRLETDTQKPAPPPHRQPRSAGAIAGDAQIRAQGFADCAAAVWRTEHDTAPPTAPPVRLARPDF